MNKRIGIVGGGQLAAFLVDVAIERGNPVTVLDPEPRCPAGARGVPVIVGAMTDADALDQLAVASDVMTVDLEAVNVEALAHIDDEGTPVIPRPRVLASITNKLTQKQALQAAGIPTSQFIPFDGQDLSVVGSLGWPAVNKAATGGYDGRGVAIIDDERNLDQILPVPGFIEAWVEHDMEIAVMVARGSGTTITYDPVEMVFNPAGNLLDELVAPARISEDLRTQAMHLAKRTVEAFDGEGLFGIEMFLTPEGELLVNEVSPRTHNSGHYTMDACDVSQFEQQYRILMGQPPVAARQLRAAVMFNLLGAPGFRGATVIEGQSDIERLDNVHAYIYGKHECFPLRKMGHVTVTAETVEEALQLAARVRPMISIRGAEAID